MIKAVLFDLDGTLIDSTEYIYQAFEHTLGLNGFRPIPRTKIRHLIGRSLSDTYGTLVGPTKLAVLRRTHGQFQEQNFSLVKKFPATNKILSQLHRDGKVLAIVTSRNQYVFETLDVAKLPHQYFSIVVGGLDVANHKPHPEAVMLALKKLKLNADQAVFVGDGAADMEAAKAADLAAAIGVTYGFGTKLNLQKAGADYLIDSITELPKLIESINTKQIA